MTKLNPVFALALLFSIPLASIAAPKIDPPKIQIGPLKPLTTKQILKLHRKKTPHWSILNQARTSGLKMRLNRSTDRSFRSLGFSNLQITALRKVVTDGPQPTSEVDKKADDLERISKAKCGPRKDKHFHATQYKRVERAIAKSGLQLIQYQCGNITLICTKKTGETMVPFAKSVNEKVITRFPGTYAKGLNPKSAHIAIIDNQYDWETWIKAYYAVLREDGFTFSQIDGKDPEVFALPGPGLLSKNICHVNGAKLDGPTSEKAKHYTAFDVGYLYIKQLTEDNCPDPLVTGFGNVVEEMGAGYPSVMVYSYSTRALGKGKNTWQKTVAQRFNEKKNPTPRKLISEYSTINMQFEQYADAWSFAKLLTGLTLEWEQLTRHLRDNGKGTTRSTILKLYNTNEKDLEEAWKLWATSQK